MQTRHVAHNLQVSRLELSVHRRGVGHIYGMGNPRILISGRSLTPCRMSSTTCGVRTLLPRPVSCMPVTKDPVSHMHRCNRSKIFQSVTCLLGKLCLYSLSASKSFPFARPYI
ncbi:hypothetical protein AVEN_193494-1 [Araneus ventricosus]|uniref:Uncharacterized protein n=1 Tax=Araneus ventricosus TaxID=182803 RepID=A0A4Y2KLW0_ARAVE|nr:hypothetical protein AVEN_193494-1 [Araneus ventricosus]